ncbi:IS110 family RNA-guided transposase [Phytohabitans aurantiacus]|uniref:Mini-circle putative transposase for IS117 n=1 Tax=Phytohabitans aurantiacus TaxID=3016789 RepID=A0ABQ5QY31_9ACTN|nr:IS110 family transposase [Phytohabitans aurantiacus]GLH98832.1 mini-circle putative transposase for IS117 [Phytohabitans aurantiacus]
MGSGPRFFAGIDWSHHGNDVAVIDRCGVVVARARVPTTPHGLNELFALLRGLRASHTHGRRQVPVAIETTEGLLVETLRAKGQPVFHVPPSLVAVWRRRLSPTPKKSDQSDAELLALIVRDGWGRLRPLPEVSAQAASIRVLAHAQRRAQVGRERLQATLRALLAQAHPAAVTAWAALDHGLRRAEARAVLAAGPTAATAKTLTAYRLSKILSQAGRIRLVDAEAYRLRDLFAAPVLRLPPHLEKAMAIEVRALLSQFDHACQLTDHLTAQFTDAFLAHELAQTFLSFPGCGALTGARLLAELGDDLSRFTTAAGLRSYAGLAPLTWESGTSRLVMHRRICNRRLKATCHWWAFATLTRSPGCRALYDRRRAAGDSYGGALRRVAGRLLGGLHHCLTTNQTYHEHALFPTTG